MRASVGPTCVALLTWGWACAQAQPARDQPARLSEEYEQCLAHAESNAAMHTCVAAEAGRWEARLNAAYQAILADRNYDARGKAELRDAQRAWVVFRTRACNAEGDLVAAGGTAAPLIAAQCTLDQTAQRAAELERIHEPGGRAPSRAR